MNARLVVSIALLLTSWRTDLRAQIHNTNRLSAALKEFLSREGVRDPETGAILKVRPKTPRFTGNPPLGTSSDRRPDVHPTKLTASGA